MRISYKEIYEILFDILLRYKFSEKKAAIMAETFASTSLDGVYSHGINRFERFIQTVVDGYVKPDAEPTMVSNFGNIERWNGNLGPGTLNASFSMKRAMELAGNGGIGCVALSNTNHWMRGGTYGWQAAEAGFIGICWTNTNPNMPPWGGKTPTLGNNPLIMAIPRKEGHIVLDMAMSQYSFGKLQTYSLENKKLPFPCGWNDKGELTHDPDEVIANERIIPTGLWKGSSLSLVLDLLASILSGGDSTADIGLKEEEYDLSQVFISFNITGMNSDYIENLINEVLANLKSSEPLDNNSKVYYPGEQTLLTRNENKVKGIPVNKIIWESIKKM